MKLRCLIVDDESMARKLLADNVRQMPFLELVGSAKNAFEAMEFLQRESIDLMFLDIQMPGMNGNRLLKSLPKPPMVIVVSAYQEYALEGYELDVLDYVLKPVSLERFSKAVLKAFRLKEMEESARVPTSPPPQSAEGETSFFVPVEYALVKVVVADICHIEGMKDYVKIHLSSVSKPIITKATLKGMMERLPEDRFMRVHKSYIVCLSKVGTIRSQSLLVEGQEVPVSEARREALLQQLAGKK